MKRFYRYIGTMLLTGAMLMPQAIGATGTEQRNATGGNHRTSTTTGATPNRTNSSNRGNNNTNRPGNATPGNNKPGNNNPGKPGNNNPGFNNPGKPGNNNPGKPGNNNPGYNNPGKPGGNHPGYNPGHNHGGNSAPRPGSGSPSYGSPGYGPGYPGHPGVPNKPRWERPIPPPPPRYQYTVIGVPPINGILGLTFGSLFNYGITNLLNAGYTVASAYNNTIYLNNVTQYGITWPQASIYYGPTGMTGARFEYASYSSSNYRYNVVYNNLLGIYGAPVQQNYNNGVISTTWWGGNNTGYITLQFGPGYNELGTMMYYTDLVYGI